MAFWDACLKQHCHSCLKTSDLPALRAPPPLKSSTWMKTHASRGVQEESSESSSGHNWHTRESQAWKLLGSSAGQGRYAYANSP